MLLLFALICAATLGHARTGTCDRPWRYLVSFQSARVYVWPGEEVDLYCRPPTDDGCLWVNGEQVLGNACHLSTTRRGPIKCMRGDEVMGMIHLIEPASQDVEGTDLIYAYDYYDFHNLRYVSDSTEAVLRTVRERTFLCSDTGKIIGKSWLCDGTRHCINGEDEQDCNPMCGTPNLRKHSNLTTPDAYVYPPGAQAEYTCEKGFGFLDSLNWFRRTCHKGQWSGEPPICHKNVAFNRPVTIKGKVIGGSCLEVVNDGTFDNWCVLMPTAQPSSVSVQLATNASVNQVLVRSPDQRYQVSLRDADETRAPVACSCASSPVASSNPSLSGLAVCSCPTGDLPGPASIVVSKERSTFMSLSVAEIAAFAERALDEAGDSGDCAYLDQPAYGSYEPVDDGRVRLVCQPGYRANCTDVTPCRAVASGAVRLSCRPLTCPPPPVIPHAVVRAENGTAWMAMTEYACAAGYQLYPPEQRTTAVCEDGLWSLSHIVCLPETEHPRGGAAHEPAARAQRERATPRAGGTALRAAAVAAATKRDPAAVERHPETAAETGG
ncbi:uncharacterized protein LOC119097134 [Pollicipes pollicipes]|uniref:uncharacterized protein LOC119097134 n=1 Tax=Pollicipes pollicipes TaxID=41117 RepID=UPI001884906F|nr:uncharacterized protein LOC119097134 [Pollicipes pollicipes]